MLWCVKGKGTGFLVHGLLGLPGDKSTWAVMLFKRKGGRWRDCPHFFLPLLFYPIHTSPPTSLPPSPIKTFLAGTFNLWVQFSAPVLLACPQVHTAHPGLRPGLGFAHR